MIRPVLSFSVVKGMYNFTGLVIRVFQFLLIVPDTKLLQSVVWTGMALDRGGLATYNRFTRSSFLLSCAASLEGRAKTCACYLFDRPIVRQTKRDKYSQQFHSLVAVLINTITEAKHDDCDQEMYALLP
ncbi:hypothetical protein B4901_14500 [Yersinia frederiksenii]|nr:hypothetical protein B4901_14500 [Yersinia frederiksenii]